MSEMFSVLIETKNPVLDKTLEKIIHGVEGFYVKRGNGHEKVDLLIYDIGKDIEKDFQNVQVLINLGKIGAVFLTSENTEPAVLMRAIRTGAKEFISQPIEQQELRRALEGLRKQLDGSAGRRLGEIFTIMGCKGGVGSTTIAVNLALSLNKQQSVGRVALVDMNLMFGEIPLFLNFKPKYTWVEIAKNIARLDDAFLTDILYAHQSGMHVLPSPNFYSTADITPQILVTILSHMRRIFDYIVIDGGNSLNEMIMKTLEISNRVLLVSLLSLPCLSNTGKLLRSFGAWGYPRRDYTDIIINRFEKENEFSIADSEKSINKKIFWTVPNDYLSTMKAINQGVPLDEIAPKAPVTRSFSELAQKLIPADEAKALERVFFKKLRILKPMFKGV